MAAASQVPQCHKATPPSVLIIIRLLEEEVGSQLLVLVARKVCLYDLVARKAQPTQSFNSIAFFFRHADGHCSGGHWAGFAHSADGLATNVLVSC